MHIPDQSLELRPIVSGFSSVGSKLQFYYCGMGAHGSNFLRVYLESERVFGLPTVCSVLARGTLGER